MKGIRSRLYPTTTFLDSSSSKLRGVLLKDASGSSFSLPILPRGEDMGGDCASVLSVVLEEMEDERFLFLESALVGLDLLWLERQIKASP